MLLFLIVILLVPKDVPVREHHIVPGPSILKKVPEGTLSEPMARCALALAAMPLFSGVPALEWAGTIPERGALTEEFAALTDEVPALAHQWAAPAH
jgi:hypothetical protein